MSDSAMISCMQWLPKGSCAQIPDQYELSNEEMAMLTEQQKQLQINNPSNQSDHNDEFESSDNDTSDSENDNDEIIDNLNLNLNNNHNHHNDNQQNETVSVVSPDDARTAAEERLLNELNIDEYENDSDVNHTDDDDNNNQPSDDASVWLSGRQLTVYNDNSEDPYITLGDADDSDSDDEQLIIQPNDNVLLVGNTDELGENSNLEMYIYDVEAGDLYVHHDIPLPAFPLAIQWINCDPRNITDTGSFACIGTFDACIEIWNLDVVDALEPVASLGVKQAVPNKKFNSSDKQLPSDTHSDAVTSLSWHPARSNILASGSADHTIRIWDLSTLKCTHVLIHHTSKLISIQWNLVEPNILLSAAEDKTVSMVDIRATDKTMKLQLGNSIESIQWSRHQPFMFAVTFDDGTLQMHDARKLSSNHNNNNQSLVFTIQAHEQACTTVSFNAVVPTLLATCGMYNVIMDYICSNIIYYTIIEWITNTHYNIYLSQDWTKA